MLTDAVPATAPAPVAVPRRMRTRRVTAAATVALLGLGIGVVDAVYAPRARVALPPAGASPQQVTTAFFDALAVKDSAAALALVAPGDGHEQAGVWFWMEHTWSLRDVVVDPGSVDPEGGDVFSGCCPDQAEVRLAFTPHWLPWVEPQALGLDPGPVTRFVTLGRQGPGQRWAVLEEGSGP